MPECCGIDDVVEMCVKADLLHQVACPPMLLVGRQQESDAALPESGEFSEQIAVEAGIVFEPVVDQCFGVEVGRNLCENA